MIKRTKADVYVERLYCDECNEEMEYNGGILASYPAQYMHVCKKCGKTVNIPGGKFPDVHYEEIE